MSFLEQALEAIRRTKPRNVVFFTGAGVSAESGIPTFRGAGGLWRNFRAEDLATPAAFARDPELVLEWYEWRRGLIRAAEPNAAHQAIARMADAVVVTQNVDGLHARAGSRNVIELHGNIFRERPSGAHMRPDVVWFGEMPYGMDDIFAALREADLFVSIGTSGAVYPAAGFVQAAAANGARTLELNLVPSEGTRWFHEARHGRAGELVPGWVDELLA